ncbi:SH3 domain-containing protein [Sphaerimonospora cavernae]|uniref:SH3 domain-containing protein n=1 Tax=Sphaerimonospora cavernae TaxID=1740611 RepID=A0ABV6UBB4_9ACTN
MTIAKRIIPVLTACATAGWLMISSPSAQADAARPDPQSMKTGTTVQAHRPALACAYKVRHVRHSSFLNVRRGPGVKHRPVGKLTVANGRFAGACSASRGWVAVKTSNGRLGWAHARYLHRVHSTPVIKIPDLACAYQLRKVHNKGFLNVRRGPSVRYRPVGRLRVADGRFVGSCGSRHGWAAVKAANGREGWASTHYLHKVN